MPLRLNNYFSTFQFVIDDILSSIESQFSIALPGDIVIISRTICQRIEHTPIVRSLLEGDSVTLKLKMLPFWKQHRLWCFIFRPERFELARYTTDFVRDLRTPTAQTDLRSLIGLRNVLLIVVLHVARIVALQAIRFQHEQEKGLGQLYLKELTAL